METNSTGEYGRSDVVQSKVVTQSPDQIDIATTVTGSQATDYDIEKSTGLGAAEIILRVVCLVSYGALST